MANGLYSVTDELFDDGESYADASFDSIHLLLMPDSGKMLSQLIPADGEGSYGFDGGKDSINTELLYLYGENGRWEICCRRPAFIFDKPGSYQYSVTIDDKCLYEVRNTGSLVWIYAEKVRDHDRSFHSYRIISNNRISIGSAESGNDIVYMNRFVSHEHAVIYRKNNSLRIKDLSSRTGTWVNDHRIQDATLTVGDRISILGLEIIAGTDFIAVNDGHPDIRLDPSVFSSMSGRHGDGLQQAVETVNKGDELFNRMPRRIIPFEPEDISIEAPPIPLNSDSIPMLLRMGSPLVMGGASALSGHYLMLLSMVLFPFLTHKFSAKQKKEYEERRLSKYREYLEKKHKDILNEKIYEENVLSGNYPELNRILKYPTDRRKLWERRKTDNDFLLVRIGSGTTPMHAAVDYPKERFNMDEDVLETEMRSLATTPVFIEEVPIMTDLTENFVCSTGGRSDYSAAMIRRLIMSIAVLNSYDEVKLVILAEEQDLTGEFEFLKYIPHTWDDEKSIRYIAASPWQSSKIGERIRQDIARDLDKPRKLEEILKEHPYYIVLAMNKRLFDSMDILKAVMQQENNCGISIITMFDEMPKECRLLIDMQTASSGALIYLRDISRKDERFKLDDIDKKAAEAAMKCVANTHLKNVTKAYSLPKTLSFLEMFNAGRLEHLNVKSRWAENNPVKSLAVPVGVATDGSVLELDLHQHLHGPHGLVAGTTGSGKSEFLITYILSLAINFRPEEVAFILIDYKGGGLAGAFNDPAKGIRLPHLAGTITNLDGSAIQRSLVSIESELMRRQRIFNEAKTVSDEGTMDIYSYQKLYRNNIVTKPLPHLFIISDEFAELKQQQPEFMDKLISTARIGRSLGVHLILATQKPAGVVNDQILSNTKFRVCLKVQDKADSMDMLKRPDAAELKDAGRFYLQVGYNDYFDLGQSAWSGAPYEPQDEVLVKKDESVSFIDTMGQIISESRPEQARTDASGTQLVAIVRMLSELAERENIRVRQLWMPDLPKHIDIEELEDDMHTDRRSAGLSPEAETVNSVSIPLGLVDDPRNQEQFTLRYDFLNSQNLILAGVASSGKSQMMQTMICSLADRYGPDEVNFFILDYSTRQMDRFGELPHCSAVLREEDADMLETFFEMIDCIVRDRKRLFSDIGADGYSTARRLTSLPLVLVFIDNIAGLSSTKHGESALYGLSARIREGSGYGIKFIVSCSQLSDMSMRLKQEFGDRICLNMKEKYDYMEALNCRISYMPPDCPGRGLCNVDGRPLEFQAAIRDAHSDDVARIGSLADRIQELRIRYGKCRRAPRLASADADVDSTYEEFTAGFSAGRIPLGFSKKTNKAIALPLKQMSVLSIYQGNPAGREAVVRNILHAAINEEMEIWAMPAKQDSFIRVEELQVESTVGVIRKINVEQSVLQEYWHIISDELVRRKELRKEYCTENGIDPMGEDMPRLCFEFMRCETVPIMILIEDFADFCEETDVMSQMVYEKIFNSLKGLNVYAICFFYPDDSEAARDTYLYTGFNKGGDSMLFGGALDKQSLVYIGDDIDGPEKMLPYNTCLMYYRSDYHVLTMPCGRIDKEPADSDADAQDIFA